ncbi:MAG: PAS domain S-box protein, partial [Myxococcota bacterium]
MAGRVDELKRENELLRLRLSEAEQTLDAIRSGQVDSLIVEAPEGLRVYALEGASNTYRVLMEAMNEGAATLTERGVISYCNGRFADLLDRPLQQVMGSFMGDHVPARSKQALEALLAAAEEEEARDELLFVGGGGEEVPVYLSVNTIEAEGRKVGCLVAVDLRPQRRTEEILASERLARWVIEQAMVPTVVCDETGRIIRASKSAAALCRCNPFLEPFEKVFPVELKDREGNASFVISRALGGETFGTSPAFMRIGSDKEHDLLVSASPLQSPSGGVLGAVVTLLEVTEARRAERALQESEERFKALADNIPQLAWMADERGRRFWFNRRWTEYTGMSSEQLRGEGWLAVHHPEHRQRALETLQRSLVEGEAWEDTFPLRGKDGEYRWFLARAVPIRGDYKGIARWFGTKTDITAQLRQQERLQEAIRLRDDFLSVASHELRTPLTALNLQLEMLRMQAEGNGSARGDLAKVRAALRQTHRLEVLISGLLDVSRIVSGRFQLHLETFDLADLARETVERTSDVAARAGCDVRLTLRGDLVGRWDHSRIDQVLMNLLTNAIKFGAGKPVDVSVASKGSNVEMRVRDRGVGISKEDQVRIFERFARASPTRHYGGLGLGLYIVREITQAHGGTVQVQSSPGKGSTFTIRLP